MPADDGFTTPLVGRDDLCAAVGEEMVATARLLTLAGPVGIGKTRIAERVLSDWESGPALWIDLGGADEASLEAILRTELRRHGAEARDLSDAFDRMPGLPLLVLDGADDVPRETAELCRRLAKAESLRLLVTVRGTLDVPEERVVEVGPFETPEADSDLERGPGFRLFVEVASRRRTLGAKELSALLPVVRNLEGHPMALELAAIELSHTSVEELVSRLSDGAPRWGGTILADALEASWRRLGDDAQALAAATATFAGRLTPEDFAWLAGHLKLDLSPALDELERGRWLRRRAGANQTARTMFAAVRSFVSERCTAAERDRMDGVHATCILARTQRRTASRFVDWRRALTYFGEQGMDEELVEVAAGAFAAGALEPKRLPEIFARIEAIAEGSQLSDLAGQAKLLFAYAARERSDLEAARRYAREVIDSTPSGSPIHLRARIEEVIIAGHTRDATADDYAEMAEEAARRGHAAEAHMMMFNAAAFAQDALDIEAALRHARRSRRLAERGGTATLHARAPLAAAWIEIRRCDVEAAERHLASVGDADPSVGTRGIVTVVRGLSRLLGGQPNVAARLFARARDAALDAHRPYVAWEWGGYHGVARIVADGWTSGGPDLLDAADEASAWGNHDFASYFAALCRVASRRSGDDATHDALSSRPPRRADLARAVALSRVEPEERALDVNQSECVYLRLIGLLEGTSSPTIVVRGLSVRVGDHPWVELPDGPSARVARALAAASASKGEPLSTAEIFSAGWPDQTIRQKSRADRVYDVVRRLRRDVFGPLLARGPAGYRLDATTRIDD